MAVERSESGGSSDGGGRRGQQQCRLQLRYDFVAAGGVGCSKGAATIGGRRGSGVHDCCGGGQRRYSVRPLLVMFTSMLAAIKIVGSERLLWAAM
ncbi:hypothetical protein B296_00022393 [Ensete ventricosum]|uniref:Uncharacterized protein n=1 Tax=Ensete ventricosum TaxID=4639 RepID=A0A426ZJ46_ENSVE|nr:hypothetical protein B296_00022393 [Ensete ventricosum]